MKKFYNDLNIKKVEKEAIIYVNNVIFFVLFLISLSFMLVVLYNINSLDKKYNNLKRLVIIQDSLLIKSIEDINGNK